MDSTGLLGGFALLWLFGAVLLVAWVALPFAMFGIKPLLRDLIKQAKITNELLRDAAKKGAKDL